MSRATGIAKDRVAFVSGSVLAWGILLAALRPWASHLYTGASLRFKFDFQDVYTGPMISPEPLAFLILNVLVALGVSIVILAACHLVAHGLLMASATEPNDLLLLVPVYPAILLQHWLVDRWSISKGLSSALLTTSVVVPLLLIVFWYLKAKKNDLKGLRGSDYFSTVALIILLYGCYVVVAETAYTMELSSSQSLYSKTVNPYIEARIRLGGATSAASDASVEVRDQSGQLVVSPPILLLDGGLFHTYFSTHSLPPGEYQLRLRYARASLTGTFPYWQRALTDSVFVSLAP